MVCATDQLLIETPPFCVIHGGSVSLGSDARIALWTGWSSVLASRKRGSPKSDDGT